MSDKVHVTFIHGLANKPPVDDLRRLWLEALAKPRSGDQGFDLGAVGVTDSFIYWADLFYDTPLSAGEYENHTGDLKRLFTEDAELGQNQWMRSLEAKFPPEGVEDAPTTDGDSEFERVPLPGFLKKRAIGRFAKEAHDYLWNVDGTRDIIRKRVMEDFARVPAGSRHVVLGHSQGTFIAYDVLTGVPDCKDIDGLMTVGSPLGVDEIQDRLVRSTEDGFPQRLNGHWVNVYDPFDAVART